MEGDGHLITYRAARPGRVVGGEGHGDAARSDFRRGRGVGGVQRRGVGAERAVAAAPRTARGGAAHRAVELDGRAARASRLVQSGIRGRGGVEGDGHLIAHRTAGSGGIVGGEGQGDAPGRDLGRGRGVGGIQR